MIAISCQVVCTITMSCDAMIVEAFSGYSGRASLMLQYRTITTTVKFCLSIAVCI